MLMPSKQNMVTTRAGIFCRVAISKMRVETVPLLKTMSFDSASSKVMCFNSLSLEEAYLS